MAKPCPRWGRDLPDFEVAVIGAGPGGLVASLYLRRFEREVVLLSAGPPRASWIPRAHNLIGFRGGISGSRLLERLHQQVGDLGLERVVGYFKVNPRSGGFIVSEFEGGRSFSARKVILATGMSDLQPELENLARLRRRGVLRYCPVCDAHEYRGERIAVLAQDAHGLQTGLFLRGFTSRIHLLWIGQGAPPRRLEQKLREAGVGVLRVKLIEIEEIETVGKPNEKRNCQVNFVAMESDRAKPQNIKVDVVYVALGSQINDSAFRHLSKLKRSVEGALIPDRYQELAYPGLFAVGDCVEGLAQISVAAGQAAIAATRVHNELRK